MEPSDDAANQDRIVHFFREVGCSRHDCRHIESAEHERLEAPADALYIAHCANDKSARSS